MTLKMRRCPQCILIHVFENPCVECINIATIQYPQGRVVTHSNTYWKKGLNIFGKKGYDAIFKEMAQLDDRECFKPIMTLTVPTPSKLPFTRSRLFSLSFSSRLGSFPPVMDGGQAKGLIQEGSKRTGKTYRAGEKKTFVLTYRFYIFLGTVRSMESKDKEPACS